LAHCPSIGPEEFDEEASQRVQEKVAQEYVAIAEFVGIPAAGGVEDEENE
jgi:hypothetical protein